MSHTATGIRRSPARTPIASWRSGTRKCDNQVGRACAVAGYVNLYKELVLLPDVHIAEEARDNGCTEIYDLIMAQDVKYDVMNDYNRTVNLENPRQANLNGDTAVRLLLEIKQALSPDGFRKHYFDTLFRYHRGHEH